MISDCYSFPQDVTVEFVRNRSAYRPSLNDTDTNLAEATRWSRAVFANDSVRRSAESRTDGYKR